MSNKTITHGTVSGYRYHKCKCDLCRQAAYASHRRWVEANKAYTNEYARKKHKRHYDTLKIEVFNVLGNVCRACGLIDARVLQIDHVNGGGREDRKKHGRPEVMFRSIIKEGHQNKYQLLCANCHALKTHHGLIVG